MKCAELRLLNCMIIKLIWIKRSHLNSLYSKNLSNSVLHGRKLVYRIIDVDLDLIPVGFSPDFSYQGQAIYETPTQCCCVRRINNG